MSLYDQWCALEHLQMTFEDKLGDLMSDDIHYRSLSLNSYHGSLIFTDASNDWRVNLEQQTLIKEHGFSKIELRHLDNWITFYDLKEVPLPARGWRRRYVSDPAAKTDRIIEGDPDPGYYEISFWPTDWTRPSTKDWLKTGYMRIVPDPLDPFKEVS